MKRYRDEKRENILAQEREKSGVVVYAFFKLEKEPADQNAHQEAAIKAIKVWGDEWDVDYKKHFTIESEKMQYKEITATEFFYPEFKQGEVEWIGNYFGAMTDPPYTSQLTKEDFERYNQVLFPNPEVLTIYLWNNTWSSFFDQGLEWWGALLWTVYDAQSGIMTVIGASATD